MSDTLVVAHGSSELKICRWIASCYRTPLETFSFDDGMRAIKLEHLEDGLLSESPFSSESELHKAYPELSYESIRRYKRDYQNGTRKHMPDLRIFPVIDIESDQRREMAFRTGEMFRDSPFYERIIPIYNKKSLDQVIDRCGYGTVAIKKLRTYDDLIESADVVEFERRLTDDDGTNLETFIRHCRDHSPKTPKLNRKTPT